MHTHIVYKLWWKFSKSIPTQSSNLCGATSFAGSGKLFVFQADTQKRKGEKPSIYLKTATKGKISGRENTASKWTELRTGEYII